MPAFASTSTLPSLAALRNLHLLPSERGYAAVHDHCLARFLKGTEPERFDAARISRLRLPHPLLDSRVTRALDPSREPTGDEVAAEQWRSEWDPIREELRTLGRPASEVQLKASSRAARVVTSPTWEPTRKSIRAAKARILKDAKHGCLTLSFSASPPSTSGGLRLSRHVA